MGDTEIELSASVTGTWAPDVWTFLGIGIGLVGLTPNFGCTIGVFDCCDTWSGFTIVDVGIVFDGFDAIINKCW